VKLLLKIYSCYKKYINININLNKFLILKKERKETGDKNKMIC
jgi:hypothetical protein